MADRKDILQKVRQRYEAVERQPLPVNLGAFLDATVARYGDRTLWLSVEDRSSLTYSQFAELVSRCCTLLSDHGVGNGERVALMLPNTQAFPVTWIACARLGAVIVPLNTRYTAHEIAQALAAVSPSLVVADTAYRDRFDDHGAISPSRIIFHGAGRNSEWHRKLAEAAAMTAFDSLDADAPVNLQFTSGSTGKPKACTLTQRYWLVLSRVRAHQGPFTRRVLLDMPFHYMGGQWRFLTTMQMGATAYVAPRPSLNQMIDRLLENRIEYCTVSPAFAKQEPDPRRKELSLVWAGTMAMPGELLPRVRDRLGGVPVCEMYGTTETGAIAAMPYEIDWVPGSCGLAAPFRQIRIVDEDGNDVPDGTTGELWVTGPGMMTGYHENKEATDQAFAGRWFRTGDLFVRDGNGFLTMLGRVKDVIRRSGENISPVEIESVLASLEPVEEVAAIPVPDTLRGEEVMVCIKLRDHTEGSDVVFRLVLARCRQQLADFKHPRYLGIVAPMPKTASGKIAKKELTSNLSKYLVERVDTKNPTACEADWKR